MAKTTENAKLSTNKFNMEGLPRKEEELTSEDSLQLQEENENKEGSTYNFCYRCAYMLEDSFIWCILGPGTPVYGTHTRTHIVHLYLLFCFIMISCLSYVPEINDAINTVTVFCSGSPLSSACGTLVPFMLIYRIGLVMATFYFIMSLLLCGVASPESTRAQFHSAFWLQKLALIILLCLAAYFIPQGMFEVIWFFIGLAGSFLMLLIQLVFIVDLAHALNDFLEERQKGHYSRVCAVSKILVISAMYGTCAVLMVYLYFVFDRSEECKMNIVLLTVNGILCTTASLVSVFLKAYENFHLETCAVTAYTFYLTYTALIYETEELCSPIGKLILSARRNQAVGGQSLIPAILLFVLILYACLRKHKPFYLHFGNSVVCRGDVQSLPDTADTERLDSTNELENRQEKRKNTCQTEKTSSYSYSLVYFVFLLASLHVMMSLTSFYCLESDAYNLELSTNWGALYMKTFSSTLVILLYIWKLIAPIIYPDKDIKQIPVLLKTLVKFICRSLFTLLFKACPFGDQSSSARFVYLFFFLAGTATSCIMYIPTMRATLESNPYFCSRISKLGNCLSMDPAYLAVYRICFAMTAFFLLFTLILFSVEYYSDPRALIQNGLWVVKFGLFFGLVLFTFFIPLKFSRIWMYVSLFGTFVFITIQLFFLLDFTKRWNSSWASKTHATGQKRWFYIILFVTVLLYIISAVAIFIFYFFFTHARHCRTNKMFTTMNLVLCVFATLISIHPKVYECGLLQSSVATAYTTYLTWSAISYNPDERCNPVAAYISQVDMRPSLNVQAIIDLVLLVALIIYFSIYAIPLSNTAKRLSKTYVNFVCRRGKPTERNESLARNPSEVSPLRQVEADPESDVPESAQRLRVSNRDEEKVPYSYSGYHFVYLMASLHVAMILTNWYSPKDNSHIKLSINWAAMCIKMISSCFCMLLYIWSLVVPLLLHNKEKNTI